MGSPRLSRRRRRPSRRDGRILGRRQSDSAPRRRRVLHVRIRDLEQAVKKPTKRLFRLRYVVLVTLLVACFSTYILVVLT